jgi:hypothetical protein
VSVDPGIISDIKKAYSEDKHFKDVFVALSDGGTPIPGNLEVKAKRYQLTDGLLYYVFGDTSRLCIPNVPSIRLQLLQEHHDTPTAGHLSYDKTYELMHRLFYWPRMDKSIKTFISSCDICQRIKDSTRRPAGLLQPLSVPSRRFEQVSLDLITQLPKSKSGYDAIVVFIDRLSKFTYFCPTTSNVDAPGVAHLFFSTVWRHHGLPEAIISDRDPRFVGRFWKGLFELCGTKLKMSTAHHPETDGQTERTNRTLEQMLRAYVGYKQDDWDRYLFAVEFAYNNSEQASTGLTPMKIATGQDPNTPASLLNMPTASAVQSTEDFLLQLQNATRVAMDNMAIAQDYQAQYADRTRREEIFKVGDQVLLSSQHINTAYQIKQHSKKLSHRWIGPYPIEQVVSKVAYKLRLPDNMHIHPVFHVSVLKRYTLNPPEFSDRDVPPRPPPTIIDGRPEFEVEKLLDKRVIRRGRGSTTQYLVKWLGYPEYEATWEPTSNLTHCQDLITEFESNNKSTVSKRQRDELSAESNNGDVASKRRRGVSRYNNTIV